MSKNKRSRKELKDSIREWNLAAQELAMKMHDEEVYNKGGSVDL